MIRNVLIFLAATHLYLYLKLRSGFGGGRWELFYLACAALGAASPFAARMGLLGRGRFAEIAFALSFTWVAIVGMVCVGFLIVDAASLAARAVDFLTEGILAPQGRKLDLVSRFFDPRKSVPVTLLLIAAVVGYSFFEAWDVRRADLTLATSKLPEGVGRLRLVHVTDVHLGGVYTLGRLERVMKIVAEAEPDILVLTGDLVDGDMRFREREANLLAAATRSARYGAFAVTGNHEFYADIDQALSFMNRAGLTVLRDSRADAAGIAIVGLDDPTKYGWGLSHVEKLPEGLVLPADRFVLLLKHRPQVIEGTVGKFDLQLSGHTHGGQIWPFNHVVRWVNGHTQHLSFRGDNEESAVYVSNGAGFWGPPLRFLVPPEVTVIDLVKK